MTPLTDTEIDAIDARWRAGERIAMWCMHHELHWEWLTEPLRNRVNYILAKKAALQIPTRLIELRPVKNIEALLALMPAVNAAMVEANRVRDAAMVEPNRVWHAAMVEPNQVRDAAMVEPNRGRHAAMVEANRVWHAAMVEADRVWHAAMVEPNQVWHAAMVEADAPLLALHRSEYPETSWNGLSIFEGAVL